MPPVKPLQKPLQGATIKDYLAILARRRWIIGISFLTVMISTAFYVYRLEDIYESYSTLVIEDKHAVLNEMDNPSTLSLSFYEGILNSRSYVEMVLDSIGLDVFRQTFPKMTRDQALVCLQSSLSLRKTSFTSFFRFNSRGINKELTYLMASIGTEIFKRRCQDVASEESRRGMAEVDYQLQLIRKNLEAAEPEYRTFCDKTGQMGQVQEGTTPELKSLQEANAASLAQLGVKEADLDAEKKQLAMLETKIAPPSSQQSPEYLKLRTKLNQLEREKLRLEGLGIRLAGASTIDREIQGIETQLLDYKQPSSTAKAVDPSMVRQWQDLRKSVIAKEAELELFRHRLESYRTAIATYKRSNPNILSESLELLRLKRSKEVYENTYNILLEKAEEERIKSASRGAGVNIVDVATLPLHPIPKNESRFYVLGLVIGLGLGLGLAFFVEFNDTTLKSNEDIEKHLNLPVLGTIPHIARKNGTSSKKEAPGQVEANDPHRLFNFEGDDSVITESYRSLRTNLSFVSPDNPLKTVLITSAGPGEGKSLTASNLAMAYAQMGKRTLLIDTDLRRPVLHRIFGAKREPGFSDLFISDNPDFDGIIKKTPKSNLFLITAGIFTPNPAELLGSYKMEKLNAYFRQNFDMVFFDTPPIVAVTDSTLLGTKMDGLLLVIKSHHTDRDIALWAVNSLRKVGIRILGSVFNDIDLTQRYSSYGYYKYYYHYYKSKKS
jgi:capsular exopolysaccharide synthesis family protein